MYEKKLINFLKDLLATHKVFFDIDIHGIRAGRVVIALFGNDVNELFYYFLLYLFVFKCWLL